MGQPAVLIPAPPSEKLQTVVEIEGLPVPALAMPNGEVWVPAKTRKVSRNTDAITAPWFVVGRALASGGANDG